MPSSEYVLNDEVRKCSLQPSLILFREEFLTGVKTSGWYFEEDIWMKFSYCYIMVCIYYKRKNSNIMVERPSRYYFNLKMKVNVSNNGYIDITCTLM